MSNYTSLKDQCEKIGWPLHIMYANYLGSKKWSDRQSSSLNPEEVVAGRFSAEGQICSWCEGGSFNLLMKAASLDVLAKRNFFNDRTDAIRRYFEAQCTILKDFESELLDSIRNVSRDHLNHNIVEVCADPFIQEAYPRVSQDFLFVLANVVETDFLAQVAAVFMKNPYDYRSGWPDITVVEAKGISFVEVKTTDQFHSSQLRFANEVANPLGFACCTVQLKPALE